jgi:hypothetical protein
MPGQFLDAPVDPVFTDATGFYTTSVAQGTWTLKASAELHTAQEVSVVVDGNKVQDFLLDPLPCVLLVDDDLNGPDVRAAYTDALDDLGYGYNVWDTNAQGDPAAVDLTGYQHLVWFTGFPYSGTFTPDNEAAVGAFLDAGGNFFFSSQDYLYDFGLTPFGLGYLHIASFTSDVNQTTVTGQNVFTGLGPYTLSGPFTNYSDTINPDAQAQVDSMVTWVARRVSFDGANFNTVFLGYPFEFLPNLAARSAVLGTTVDFFGGCEVPWAVSVSPFSQQGSGDPGAQVVYEYTVTNLGPDVQDVNLVVSGNEWFTEAPASTGVLDSGASATVAVTVTIPTELSAMSDSFTLNASGVEGGFATASGTTTANVNPAVEVTAPAGGSAASSKMASYEFSLTNTGDYTDTFTLEVMGVDNHLARWKQHRFVAPGASTTFVLVEVPAEAVAGDGCDHLTAARCRPVFTPSGDPRSLWSVLPILLK